MRHFWRVAIADGRIDKYEDHYRLLLAVMYPKVCQESLEDIDAATWRRPAVQLARLLCSLHLLAQDDIDDNDTQLRESIQQQLHSFQELWRVFFYRGNDNGYGSPKIQFGPQVLGFADSGDIPMDFYLWLQDACSMNASISKVIDEVVEPGLENENVSWRNDVGNAE